MIGLGFPSVRVFHNPDGGGAGSNNERIHYLYLYEGVEPAGAPDISQSSIYKWTTGGRYS